MRRALQAGGLPRRQSTAPAKGMEAAAEPAAETAEGGFGSRQPDPALPGFAHLVVFVLTVRRVQIHLQPKWINLVVRLKVMAKPRLTDANMQRPLCNLANSVLETDLEMAAKLNLIEALAINETERGYYVTVTFKDAQKAEIRQDELRKLEEEGARNVAQTIEQLMNEPDKVWYLTTRRERNSPRLHRDLGRLNGFLREKYPTDVVFLLRNKEWPGKASVRTRGAQAKRKK